MANIKSSKKRIKTNESARERNRAQKSEINTYVRKFNTAITSGETELASELLKECNSRLDKAATDNVIHANKAARVKGKLAKKLV